MIELLSFSHHGSLFYRLGTYLWIHALTQCFEFALIMCPLDYLRLQTLPHCFKSELFVGPLRAVISIYFLLDEGSFPLLFHLTLLLPNVVTLEIFFAELFLAVLGLRIGHDLSDAGVRLTWLIKERLIGDCVVVDVDVSCA
jgi:hypothetical protein